MTPATYSRIKVRGKEQWYKMSFSPCSPGNHQSTPNTVRQLLSIWTIGSVWDCWNCRGRFSITSIEEVSGPSSRQQLG